MVFPHLLRLPSSHRHDRSKVSGGPVLDDELPTKQCGMVSLPGMFWAGVVSGISTSQTMGISTKKN